jgi:membrane associated rhomboid family serine protease/outer membrane protein assembly factor BamD (BamD/ComL family)
MIPIGTNLQRNKLPVATLSIIGVNVLFFIIELLLPEDALIWTVQNFGFGPATRNPLALFSHMFLHADIYHITFNMLFLWIFGSPVEERTGTRNFLIYYFGAGVAAAFLHLIMEMVSRPDSTLPVIGASGAVSGVMALFLYRCFYSKLKLVINPILLPRQVNVPVIPLVLFWFFKDILLGVLSLSAPTGVAHWAHIGGFIFGIAVGRIKRYGHEGQIEQLRGKILIKLEEGGGWNAAEKEFLKLLEIAPDDPEVNHDLARLYADSGNAKRAARHYQFTVQRYFATQPVSAAYTVLEHLDTLTKPMPVQYHVRAAEALIGVNEIEDAYKVLLPMSKQIDNKSPLLEKGLMLHIKLCRHLDKTEELFEGIRVFMEQFPASKYKNELRAVMNLKPGKVFTETKPVADVLPSAKTLKEEKEAERLGTIAFLERIFADPVFWSLLLFMNIAVPILMPGLYESRMSPVYVFGATFIMTLVHRMGSISDIFSHISGPSEKKARQRVGLRQLYDEAVMAEKKARYQEAVNLYEQVLAAAPGNVQARFNLARIYEKKLSDGGKARLHYQSLMELLPPGHPFHRDAADAVKALSAS